jgi:hypothetical protein
VIILPLTFIFTGCGGPDYQYVKAFVKEEFYEKFDTQEFTLADFQMENAAELHYYCSFTDYDPISGEKTGSMVNGEMVGQWHKKKRYFKITLNTKTKRDAEQAIEHLKTLEFVSEARIFYPSSSNGTRIDV